MNQDVLILNASDGFDGSTAAAANLDINVEHTLQALRPGHCRMSLPHVALPGSLILYWGHPRFGLRAERSNPDEPRILEAIENPERRYAKALRLG